MNFDLCTLKASHAIYIVKHKSINILRTKRSNSLSEYSERDGFRLIIHSSISFAITQQATLNQRQQ